MTKQREKSKNIERQKEMSEKESKEETNVVDINVALLIAEKDHLLEVMKEKDALIEELTKKLQQATDLIEEDSKAALVNVIAPKTNVDKALLSKMSVDELLKWSKVLETAKIAPFKSGTPLYDKRPDPRKELDSVYAKYMAKIRGGS